MDLNMLLKDVLTPEEAAELDRIMTQYYRMAHDGCFVIFLDLILKSNRRVTEISRFTHLSRDEIFELLASVNLILSGSTTKEETLARFTKTFSDVATKNASRLSMSPAYAKNFGRKATFVKVACESYWKVKIKKGVITWQNQGQ